MTYNALLGKRKDDFEEWAKQEYPELWARLESKGRRMTMTGPVFELVRTTEA